MFRVKPTLVTAYLTKKTSYVLQESTPLGLMEVLYGLSVYAVRVEEIRTYIK